MRAARLCTLRRCRRALVRLSPPVCERCGSPGRLARATLRGMLGPPPRLRARARGNRVRQSGEGVRTFVEGARPETAGHGGGGAHRRGDRPPRRRRARARSRRSRARLEARSVRPRGLAVALGELWSLPTCDPLRRVRSLPRQRGLALADRRRNVRGSVVAEGDVARAVCLVDDVYTSGATADACASALCDAGARRVDVVTLARAVR